MPPDPAPGSAKPRPASGAAAGPHWAVVLAIIGLATLPLGCRRGREAPLFTGEPYLAVWAGDADRKSSDFLAILDADPTSATYGKVLRTYPVRSRGNEPHNVNVEPRADRRLFAGGLLTNRTFVFDLPQPLAGKLVAVDDAGPQRRLWGPHDFVSLPNGRVAVTCVDPARYRGDPVELVTAAGGLLELTSDGQPVREIPAPDPAARGLIIAPAGAAAALALDRLITTNRGHGYTALTRGEAMPGISVQVWRLEDLRLLKTVLLEAGARGEENLAPATARFLHREPLVYVNTAQGGALYASDSVQTSVPAFRLVYDFGADTLGGDAAVTPDDRWYVETLTGRNRLVTLDLADRWHPKPVAALRFDRDPGDTNRARAGGPSALAMSADGTRLAVADYTMDVPGYQHDGDRRVYMVRLDPTTGHLWFDEGFRDELTGEVGIDFNRARWPHGDTGPARPHGLAFVTPEPPPPEGGRPAARR